jgi:hypothetical protein
MVKTRAALAYSIAALCVAATVGYADDKKSVSAMTRSRSRRP